MSWNKAMPRLARAPGLFCWPRSWNDFIATAVELSATAIPRTMLSAAGNPNAEAVRPMITAVIPTWTPPPIKAMRHRCLSSANENSTPSVNISNTTPIAANSEITGSPCVDAREPQQPDVANEHPAQQIADDQALLELHQHQRNQHRQHQHQRQQGEQRRDVRHSGPPRASTRNPSPRVSREIPFPQSTKSRLTTRDPKIIIATLRKPAGHAR